MRVALVGCGRIAEMHAAYVRRQAGIERLVVVDSDGGAAARLGARFGAAASYEDVAQMLAREAPTVVHVCTPPATHDALAVQALAAGAHVLVEKPMALGRAAAARIGAALGDDPATLCVDHNFLFEPEMLAARAWVQEGRIGDVLAADMFYGVNNVSAVAAARTWARDLPCGRFTDLLPHPLYLIFHFLGEPTHVAARAARGAAAGGAGDPTELRMLLECRRGLGAIHVSLASVPYELALTLRGTRGTIRVDFARQRAVIARERPGPRQLSQLALGADLAAQTACGAVRRLAGKASGRLRGYPGMRVLIGRFYETVRRGLPPPVSFAEGARVTEALDEVRRRLDEQTAEGTGAGGLTMRHSA